MSEPEEEIDPECSRCLASVRVRENSEWTQGESVCDPCAQDLLTEAREVLRLVEWSVWDRDSSYSDKSCPVCEVTWHEGKEQPPHAPDCRLDKAIGERT